MHIALSILPMSTFHFRSEENRYYLCKVNTQTGKLSIGLLTILPVVFIVLFVMGLLGGVHRSEELIASNDPVVFLMPLGYSVFMFILAMVTNLAVFIYYLIHIINNIRLDSSQRLVWVFVICLAGALGCLIYWLFQIWREEDDRVEHNYQS